MNLWLDLRLLLLLGVANGAPMLTGRVCGPCFGWPVDFGRRFFDDRPIFGESKTWRGLGVSLVFTALAAPVLGFSVASGCVLSAAAMAGDLFSSFLKRRMGIAPHGQAFLLDQTPESLFPLLGVAPALGLTTSDIVVTVALFVALGVVLSRLLFRLKIRDRPY
jgi:CDP-2,3-bis-(O-geranylgeranyl)-sn-glycerol synthase